MCFTFNQKPKKASIRQVLPMLFLSSPFAIIQFLYDYATVPTPLIVSLSILRMLQECLVHVWNV